MAQTYGSQIFGPLYDVVGWVAAVGIFFYFSLSAQGLSIAQRERVPRWLLNKKICFSLALFSAVMAVAKFARWI
ncbi:putative membrane protein [Burkholderia cenocepacia]|uniref:Membrane protein n=1 Tax=Burkholderia cenocepacia TaxID=95486 RepID=A0AAN0RY42_9BURK|nr:putative membrane protein [Burkholderia cenocepacia]